MVKIVEVCIPNIQSNIIYFIGKSAKDNFLVLDKGKEKDIWFHIANESSCHVVATIPENINKKQLYSIIKQGANLCKSNTKKLSQEKNIEIIYTHIKNVHKTEVEGRVIAHKTKTIFI